MAAVPSWAWWLFFFILFLVNFFWAVLLMVVHQRSKGRFGGTVQAIDFRPYSNFGRRINRVGLYAPRGVVAAHRGDGWVDIQVQRGFFGREHQAVPEKDLMWVPGLNVAFIGFGGVTKFIEASMKSNAEDAHRLRMENAQLADERRRLMNEKTSELEKDLDRLNRLSSAVPFVKNQTSPQRRRP